MEYPAETLLLSRYSEELLADPGFYRYWQNFCSRRRIRRLLHAAFMCLALGGLVMAGMAACLIPGTARFGANLPRRIAESKEGAR